MNERTCSCAPDAEAPIARIGEHAGDRPGERVKFGKGERVGSITAALLEAEESDREGGGDRVCFALGGTGGGGGDDGRGEFRRLSWVCGRGL